MSILRRTGREWGRPAFRADRSRSVRPGHHRSFRAAGQRLEPRELLASDVIISEFMAANSSGLTDADGDTSDWIELHNISDTVVDLNRWSVTDDEDRLRRWSFPSVSLAPGDYLVLFASSKDRREAGRELHTNFRLSQDGEYLGLMRADGTIADEYRPDFGSQLTDRSFGVGTIGGVPVRGYMAEPTPGAANARVFVGVTGEVQLGQPGGIQDAPLVVDIQSDPGAVVRFTTDGSIPTATTGTIYTAPLAVDTTTTLRAAAFQPDYLPSPVVTSTYVFLDDVVRQTQPDHFPPLPSGDYDVDPDVALSAQYSARLHAGLRDLPSVSIVLPVDAFLGQRGIYSHPQQRGEAWERAASVEWFAADGSPGFQIDAGLRIQGGASRNPETTPKHSFSIRFREEYGASELEYPLFSRSPVTTFTSLSLRGGSNNTWLSGSSVDRSRAQYQRDQWVRDTMLGMGHEDAGRGEYVHLYINGLYWGLYNLTERPTASHYAEYVGGDDDDYDALNGNQVVDGTRDSLERMRATVAGGDWNAIQAVLDVDQFIDYNIVNRYGSNSDLDASRNYRLAGGGPGNAPWHVYPWDSEEVLYGEGSTGLPTDPVGVRDDLEKLLEYRIRFGDRLHQHLFNTGALTPESAAERWTRRAAEIDRAIIGESARWGDHRREARPYGRDTEWLAEQTRLLKAYFPARSDVLLDLYRNEGLYPPIDAPVFAQHGGLVRRSRPIGLSALEGSIFYTVDGSDPRLPGGEVNPAAQSYAGPFTLAGDARVQARTLHEGQWSALTSASFLVQSDLPLSVSEIQAAPHRANLVDALDELSVGNDEFEFIELTNIGSEPIDLQDVRLVEQSVDGAMEGMTFQFAAQSLAPGEQLVVPRHLAAFVSRYGGSVRLAAGGPTPGVDSGQFGGELDDRGEQITLVDAEGAIIQQFDYAAAVSEHSRAAGRGSSLEAVDANRPSQTAGNWRASRTFGGSPGRLEVDPDREVIVSEMLLGDEANLAGWIAFQNLSDQTIDLEHWYLGNPDEPLQTNIGEQLTIDPHTERTIDQAALNLTLDAHTGGEIWLIRADDRGVPLEFADHFRFPIHSSGVTVGRPVDDQNVVVPLSFASPGALNAAALVDDLIVSEIQFDPPDYDGAGTGLPADNFEFIEIYNRSHQEIDLENWRLVGDIDFTFDRGTRIAAGGTVLVVNFLPTRVTQANPFREAYGVDRSAAMAGPYLGRLPNRSGTVQLERPLGVADPLNPLVPYAIADRVDYDSQAPWPPSTAGLGDALHRTVAGMFGNRPTTWQAGEPAPSRASFSIRLPGDSDEDGRFNTRDLVQIMQLGKFAAAVAATFAEGDWNRDGRFDIDDLFEALALNQYETAQAAAHELLAIPANVAADVREAI